MNRITEEDCRQRGTLPLENLGRQDSQELSPEVPHKQPYPSTVRRNNLKQTGEVSTVETSHVLSRVVCYLCTEEVGSQRLTNLPKVTPAPAVRPGLSP